MESSQEEIYSESLPSEHDSITLSRFTIYHSAPDLPDAMAEQTILFTNGTKTAPAQQVGIEVNLLNILLKYIMLSI